MNPAGSLGSVFAWPEALLLIEPRQSRRNPRARSRHDGSSPCLGPIDRVGMLLGGRLRAVSAKHPEPTQPVMISMELLANRPIVRATINGQGPFPFLLGSEDQRTIVDPELAETLKLKLAKGATELTVDLGFGPAQHLQDRVGHRRYRAVTRPTSVRRRVLEALSA